MPTLKYSRQRESIRRFLMSRKDHPTADIIYQHVREEFPNISLGTVYRNLSLLTDRGEILRLTTDGPDRYDAYVEPHCHFLCRKCQALIDVHLEDESIIDQQARRNFTGTIDGHSILYYGLCPECSK